MVVAAGMRSFQPLTDALKDKIPLYLLGDSKKGGKSTGSNS